jgi:hypothetical protein
MKLQSRLCQAPLIVEASPVLNLFSVVKICHAVIYGVRALFVAARRGVGWRCLQLPPVVGHLVLFRSSYWVRWTKEKSLLFVQGSMSHLFTLIMFESTRRGQSLGRWNVDPVYAALLCTGLFVRSGLTICSAGASPKGTLISSISSSRFGGGLSSKSNALP